MAQKAHEKTDSEETGEGTSKTDLDITTTSSDEKELENGRKAHPIVNEVEVKTGEEDEQNLFHVRTFHNATLKIHSNQSIMFSGHMQNVCFS